MASIPDPKATTAATSSSVTVKGMDACRRWRSSNRPAAVVAGMESRNE